MQVDALLFDLDGTLADTEQESAEAMARAYKKRFDLDITEADRSFIIGRSWVDIYRRMAALYPNASWTQEDLIASTTEAREEVFADGTIVPLPGVLEVFANFKEMPKALVTGSSRGEAKQTLKAIGLTNAFGAIFAAEDVPTSKPDPAGYLAAAAALGVDITKTVVMEDSEAGISAGLAAGATVVAVAVGNFAGQRQSHAHRCIKTLEEFTPALLLEL